MWYKYEMTEDNPTEVATGIAKNFYYSAFINKKYNNILKI